MIPLSPHDPIDDLMAAALHGELTPGERERLDAHLQNNPAARAAYQKAQLMHALLEDDFSEAKPDPAFEQRMVAGVRRRLVQKQKPETAWESALALWVGLRRFFAKRRAWEYAVACVFLALLAGVAYGPITRGIRGADGNPAFAVFNGERRNEAARLDRLTAAAQPLVPTEANAGHGSTEGSGSSMGGGIADDQKVAASPQAPTASTAPAGMSSELAEEAAPTHAPDSSISYTETAKRGVNLDGYVDTSHISQLAGKGGEDAPQARAADTLRSLHAFAQQDAISSPMAPAPPADLETKTATAPSAPVSAPSALATTPAVVDTRKLIRNAQLDLEVKSFPSAMDQIAALTRGAGGYVDTSNSQRGGNGKLQGTVIVKVLPSNLDGFLLKLRDLGRVQNQSVSTDDVTKDYFDTQARLDNSRRMETQLQALLQHENSKVSDLLQVERELGRVRGDIEQMQGQLKLYDFQVQYATVTLNVRENDLNQAAAYLLKEQDDFSLFATDVEDAFRKARQAADTAKAQILTANLAHNSGSDVAADLTVMVAPEQIDSFLAQVRTLGRVANFTRQTQRVARDGGDSDQPADQTLTEKDKVQVHISIRSDDETRKQVGLTVVTRAVDRALDQAKTAALAQAGVEVLSSALTKSPQGQSTAQLVLRVPGNVYTPLLATLQTLGRTSSLSIQRNDDAGPGANGDDAPVIVSLGLTDDDAPLQQTEMSVLTDEVESHAQQIKQEAASAGVELKASSFERQPDGTELARLTFHLPLAKYPAFVKNLTGLGKVETLSVHRDDRPDQAAAEDSAPAEINLQLHNQRDIVGNNSGWGTTLRQTFGAGADALFASVRMIGVIVAFVAPWLFTLALLAWVGRRIYVWKRR